MTRLTLVVLCVALLATCYADEVKYDPQPTPNSPNTTTGSPTTPLTTITTSKPITTPKPTIAPTSAPPITTPSPPTTTPSLPPTTIPTKPPTTIPTKPPTTIPTKPTSPHTPKPTPTPQPPKPSDPIPGLWQVNYTGTNITCIMVHFAMQIQVPYNTTVKNTTHMAYVNVSPNATVIGACGNVTEEITLEWKDKDAKVANQINLKFSVNATANHYRLDSINVTVNLDKAVYPNINESTLVNLTHDHNEFRTGLSKSYRCLQKQNLNLTESGKNDTLGTLSVDHLQFQAFVNATSKQFTTAEDCASSDTPDVVPIAVGCALAALVIIVLIAYLIGRRRRQARGYLSM